MVHINCLSLFVFYNSLNNFQKYIGANIIIQSVSPEEEEKKEIDTDLDNPKYIKAQILFLKEENLRLTKISNVNAMKQQMMELWDSMFYKDVELRTKQQQIDQLQRKLEAQKIEIIKMEKQMQCEKDRNFIDIQQKMNETYNNQINSMIDKIKSSSPNLNQNALNAMTSMKKWMKQNEEILTAQYIEKQNEIHSNLQSMDDLGHQQIDLYNLKQSQIDFLRIESVEELINKRKAMQIDVVAKIDSFLCSINCQKAMIEQQIATACDNKFNECFFSHFIQAIAMNFYDAKLIKSQFLHNANPKLFEAPHSEKNEHQTVLCKDGEKMLFDIPLTYKLLKILRNEESNKNLVYDILCLEKFCQNMVDFEFEVSFNDSLTFSSVIGVELMKAKNVQNIIKSAKHSTIFGSNDSRSNGQNVDGKTNENLQQKAIVFADNLTYLIVTGYALLIMNVMKNKEDYIQCLSNLCLCHPSIKTGTIPKSIHNVGNEDKLKRALQAISSIELKRIINEYFVTFGSANFLDNIIK